MKLPFLVAWFCVLILVVNGAFAADDGHPPDLKFMNRDGTVLFARSAGAQGYRVSLRGPAGTRTVGALRPWPDPDPGRFDLRLVDVDQDGFGDAELQGACGNRACRKQIWLFDPTTRRLGLLFDGEYSTAEISDGFLIVGAGSGCCSHESRLFRWEPKGRSVPAEPELQVTVASGAGGDGGDRVTCTFVDAQLQRVKPPASLLRLCEVYGKAYQLAAPGN